MAEEEKETKTIHGFEIDSNGHHKATDYLERHVDSEQLKEMVHNAKHAHDRNSHFTAHVEGKDIKYKLEHHHDGKLTIDIVKHN